MLNVKKQQTRISWEIVPATEELISEVEGWLLKEREALKASGDEFQGFYCNWGGVKSRWRKWHAPLDILLVNGEAVGFLVENDILEIKPDRRRSGYGRLLAQFMINRAKNKGDTSLKIEIYPPSARPFWESFGFVVEQGVSPHCSGPSAHLKFR